MEAKDLGERVLKCLSSKKKKCEALNKLVQTLRVQKKSLNQCLYKLQHQKKVIKLQISPPIWGLPEIRSIPMTKSKGPYGRTYSTRGKKPMAKDSKDTEKAEKVLQLLESKTAPLKATEIARAIGLSRAAEVNSVLYSMEKEGLVSRLEGKPLTWTVNRETGGISPTEVAMPAVSLISQSVATSGFPEFQDSELFGSATDVDCSDTEEMKDVVQEEADNFQDPSEDTVIPGQQVSMNLFDSHSIVPSKGPSITNKLFEDFDVETGDSETGHMIKHEFKPEDADLEIDGGETDMNEVQFEQGNSLPVQNCFKVDVDSGPVNNVNTRIPICKSESFGFSSLTVSSEGENRKLLSTPLIMNELLDLEEDLEIREKNVIGDSGGNSDGKNVITAEGDDTDMENCIKILKPLAVIPGMAQFVLLNKTKLSKEDFEVAINKCQSLGYVSGCSKLWKITPEGIEYIEDKMDENENNEHPIEIVNPQPQKEKPSGPPPPPMVLLKTRGHVQENLDRESQSVKLTRLFRDRSPLMSHVSRTAAPATYSSENMSRFSGSSMRYFGGMSNSEAIQADKSSNLDELVHSSLFDTHKQSYPDTFDSLNRLTDSGCHMKGKPSGNSYGGSLLNSESLAINSNVNQVEQQVYSTRTQNPHTDTGTKSAFNTSMPLSPMEIISNGLKRTEISPPTTPSASSIYKEPLVSNSKSAIYQSMSFQRPSAENPSNVLSKIVPLKAPHTFQTGSWSVACAAKRTINSLSEHENTQNHSISCLSRNATVQNEFKSLPASVNKSSGPVSLNGLNSLALSNESFNILNKNPVSALMEYAQSRKTEARVEVLACKGAAHRPTFTMAAFVGSRRFPSVTCHNKKDGRKEACDIALRQLIAEGQFQAEAAKEASGTKPQASLETMTHFDKIAALTHRGFTALVSQITADSFAGRKVIAGLVMKRSEDDTGILISLGTGNRCITGQQLSLQGNTVNDSHAEIITRRGFIRFLYKQLLDYDPSKHNPLFERSRTGKLQIRSKITFHLYISTAPCGDGALFSPRDAESNKTPIDTRVRPPHEPVFSSNVQGLLRTKVEGGEGTIPIEAGFKGQTFDGIQRGERLRTMSCTDKVCRWNVVGMQGALLSHFLEPVYLDSLTLGLLYDHGHLSRAVCCRVGRGNSNIEDRLPNNYRLNHPWLGRVTVCDPPREVQKTKSLSVNWCFGDSVAEVTDGTTGLCNTSIEKGLFSRCSKRSFFNSFKAVCEKFDRQDLLQAETYKDVKMMATDFQQAREAMLAKFKENKYGPWVSKPVEEEMFGWEEHR